MPDNLRYMCHDCHVAKTKKDRTILAMLRGKLKMPISHSPIELAMGRELSTYVNTVVDGLRTDYPQWSDRINPVNFLAPKIADKNLVIQVGTSDHTPEHNGYQMQMNFRAYVSLCSTGLIGLTAPMQTLKISWLPLRHGPAIRRLRVGSWQATLRWYGSLYKPGIQGGGCRGQTCC